jgi:hypothetical protein
MVRNPFSSFSSSSLSQATQHCIEETRMRREGEEKVGGIRGKKGFLFF